jgi:MFS family permease
MSEAPPELPPAEPGSIWQCHGLVRLSCARLFSVSAVQMQAVAVGWLVYDMTKSAVALGLIGLAQFLPLMALVLFAGHAADRFPRRTLLAICYAVEFAASAGIGLVALRGGRDPAPVFALVMLYAAARAFESPTTQSLLPSLVPPALLSRAIAGNTSANQTATIFAPALGGLLYGLGAGIVFGICALALAVSFGLVLLLPRDAARPARTVVGLATLFAGIGFIARQKIVMGAISLDLFAVLFGGATALLPIYARDILHAGPAGLGLLRSAPAAGAFLMALVLARHPIERRAGHILFATVGIYGVATILFGLSRAIPLSLAALVLLGAADVVSMVIRQTLVQMMTPDELRGRVSAVSSLFTGTSNQLGEFRAGMMAAWLGPVAAVVLGGVGTLAIVAGGWRLFPALRRAQGLRPPLPRAASAPPRVDGEGAPS